MTGYYVLAAISVVWALVLTGIGLTRPSFPSTGGLARALMGFGVILALATMGVLIASTHVEHPREEAAEAAEHKAAAEEQKGEQAPEQKGEQAPAPGGPESAVKRVPVKEKEFSIQIQGGTDLAAGRLRVHGRQRGQDPARPGRRGKRHREEDAPAGRGREGRAEGRVEAGQVPLLLHGAGPCAVGHGR